MSPIPGLRRRSALRLAVLLALAPAGVAQSAPKTRTLAPHASPVVSLFYANKGKSLVTASAKGEFKVWDPRKGREIGGYTESLQVNGATLCDDKHIVFVAGSTIGAIDAKKGKFKGSVAFVPDKTRSVCFVPKYRYVFIAYPDGLLRRMPDGLASSADEWGTGASTITAMAAHPKGEVLVGGTEKGTLLFMDATQLELEKEIDAHPGSVTALAIDPKGKLVFSAGEDKSVRIFDLEKREELARFDLEHPVHSLAVTAKGDRLAAGDAQGGVHVWGTKQRKLLGSYASTTKLPVRAMAFDPKGRELALAGLGNDVTCLDVSGWKAK